MHYIYSIDISLDETYVLLFKFTLETFCIQLLLRVMIIKMATASQLLLPFSRISLLRSSCLLTRTYSSLNIKEIEEKRERGKLGGGEKRIKKQHETVS